MCPVKGRLFIRAERDWEHSAYGDPPVFSHSVCSQVAYSPSLQVAGREGCSSCSSWAQKPSLPFVGHRLCPAAPQTRGRALVAAVPPAPGPAEREACPRWRLPGPLLCSSFDQGCRKIGKRVISDQLMNPHFQTLVSKIAEQETWATGSIWEQRKVAAQFLYGLSGIGQWSENVMGQAWWGAPAVLLRGCLFFPYLKVSFVLWWILKIPRVTECLELAGNPR